MSFENRKNAYWCEACHGYVVTIDLDEGVTPEDAANAASAFRAEHMPYSEEAACQS